MEKITAWLLLGIISLIETVLLYFNVGTEFNAIILPVVAYLFGIVSKTAVDTVVKIKNNNNNLKNL